MELEYVFFQNELLQDGNLIVDKQKHPQPKRRQSQT